MKRLLRNIAWDIFLTWPLIYFGLFMQNVYAYNMAMAFFLFIGIGGIITAISIITSDEMLQKRWLDTKIRYGFIVNTRPLPHFAKSQQCSR